jgi:hypothetical protein
MNVFAKLATIFLSPFLVFSAFLGINHTATTTPLSASSTTMASSTSTNAASTLLNGIRNPLHLSGSNGGVKLPPGSYNPGGPIISVPAPTSTPATTTAANTPRIISESVSSGAVGTEVTLSGTGFNSSSIVHFASGAIQNTTASENGTKLTFAIPSSLGAYCKPDQACPMYMMLVQDGTYKLYVENVPTTGDATGPTSNTVTFTVTGSANVPL